MSERFHLRVGVTNLDACKPCPIAELHFKNKTPDGSTIYDAGTHTCRIATLEKKLRRVPTYQEIENKFRIGGRHWFDIPKNCPNKYISPYNIPASKRKG